MTTTLLIVQGVLALLIIITILLQKSSSIGLGAYSGSNDSLFGAKGPANFLARATMILGVLFVLNTLVLGYFFNQQREESAVDSIKTDLIVPTAPQAEPAAPQAPTAPATPAAVPAAPVTK